MFHAFLVEDDLVWSDRPDPYNSKEDAVFWPALVSEICTHRSFLLLQRKFPER